MSLYGGAINLWEVATGRELFVINLGDRDAMTASFNSAFCFSPDGSLLSFHSGTIRQWEALTGRQLRSTALKGRDFAFAAFSADTRSLVTVSQTMQSFAVWDTGTGAQIQSVAGGLDSATSFHAAALSPDGRMLATGEEERAATGDVTKLVVRDVASGRITQTIKVTEEKMDKRPSAGSALNSSEPIRIIRFSPDSRTIGMAIRDALYTQTIGAAAQPRAAGQLNQIKFWDAATGRETKSFNVSAQGGGSQGALTRYTAASSFAFIADGKLCASTASEPSVKLFDTASGRNVSTLAGHAGEIISIAFSSDGRQAATAGMDNTIRIWDVATAATTGRADVIRTLGNSAMPITSMAYAQDGRSLAVGGSEAVNVWEMTTGDSLRTVVLPSVVLNNIEDMMGGPQPVAFSAGGQFVAAGGADAVKVWETKTGREVKSIALASGKKAGNAALTRDGKMIALADARPAMIAQSAQSGATPQTSPSPQPPADPAAQKKTGKQKEKDARKQQEEMLKQMQQQMKSGKMPDMAEMQKMMEAMQRGEIGKAQDMASQMTASLGIASALPPPAGVRLVDVGSGNEIRAITGQSGIGSYTSPTVAFSADGRLLAIAAGGRSIKIIESASGREVTTLAPDRGMQVYSVAFSPDGRTVAASLLEMKSGVNLTAPPTDYSFGEYYTFALRLWDATTGREIATITDHVDNVMAIAFSPDGRTLASGGFDAKIRLWDAQTGREKGMLAGHNLAVNAIDFSPDGKMIASGSADGSARLWDAQTGELLAILVSVNKGADWLAITPDGLFDGTPAAWNQILWRFSPNIFDVSPVEVFFNEFFHPGLLAEIYSGKRPRASQDVSQKERRQPVVLLTRADGQTSNVTTRAIKVRIDISEPQSNNATPAGARDVRLFRNGTLVKVWRGDALKGQRQTSLEATIPIVAGENRLVAYAFNRDNVKSADGALTVAGAQELQRKGTLYVLAFGVNRYANEQYNLKYAVADAVSFAEEVQAQQTRLQNFERVEVIQLLDRDATKANIMAALNRLTSSDTTAKAPAALSKIQPARPEDAVIIYFAGHGTARGARFYLVPHDLGYAGPRNSLNSSAMQQILAHSISDTELESAVEGLDAAQLMMVIDACNSGQALEAEEKRRGPMNSKGLAQLAYEKGMYILTAAQSYQAALEAAELGHGYLTFALIEEGLKKGAADRDAKDGQVLAREWFNYAAERVPQMQEKEMRARLLLQQDVSFVEGEEKIKDPTRKSVQRPRVFYRREADARPLVVARP